MTAGSDPGRATSFKQLTEYQSSAELIRMLCVALCSSSPREMSGASLMINLAGKPGEARMLQAISARLAKEYDLREKVTVEGRTFTVSLERKVDSNIRKE